MRRNTQGIFSRTALALLLVLLPGLALAGAALPDSLKRYAPVDVGMKAVQVSKHAWFVKGKAGAATDNKGFISNAGFVVTPKGVVVLDALGTPSLAVELVKQIRKVTDKPIKMVVLTHYHADHAYGLQVFKELGAEILAPAGALDYLGGPVADSLLVTRRKELAPWVDANTHLVPPDKVIRENGSFTLGGMTFHLTLLGMAHSEGDMAMRVEPDQVLYTGDTVFEGRIPFIGETNTKNWLVQLEKLKSVKVKALVPGHGPAAKDPNAIIRATHRYLSFLREQMGKAVDEGITFDEAYERVDWSEFEFIAAFNAANRRNAYNVFLAMEKESFD